MHMATARSLCSVLRCALLNASARLFATPGMCSNVSLMFLTACSIQQARAASRRRGSLPLPVAKTCTAAWLSHRTLMWPP